MSKILKKIIFLILQIESRFVLWKYKPRVIAITGSVGKTSTKDAVYAMLSGIAYVRKSEKSYNSEIGLPLTVLGLPNGWSNLHVWIKNILKGLALILFRRKYPEWLVLEVGIGKLGDMGRTASWLKSDAVIVTTICETPVHVEFFPSKKHLVEEKSELIKTLKKDGLLILNADDEAVLEMKTKSKSRVVTYGFKEGANVLGSGENINYSERGVPDGLRLRVDVGGNSLPVAVEGVFGKNHAYAALVALALASGLKLNMVEAAERIKKYEFAPGRMRVLEGANETFIIDDSYNSSPTATYAALGTLGEIKTAGLSAQSGRRIAVLGDMLELGKHTDEAHQRAGEVARERSDVLITVGPRSKVMEGDFHFSNSREAGEFLKTFVKKGDLILVKGSQGMRLERAVEAILLDQENKANLLVRQESEWLARE